MSSQFIKDKAREISYALIRVSFYIKRGDLRSRLEKLAFELLENSARTAADNSLENLNRALASVSVLDGLVRLAYSVYEIEPMNANILIKELNILNTAIRQYGNLEEELPDISKFFSDNPGKPRSNNKYSELKKDALASAENNYTKDSSKDRVINLDDLEGDLKSATNNEEDGQQAAVRASKTGASGFNTAMRQAEIINRIKSLSADKHAAISGGARLKDLIAEFSGISERTLRYDLQKLCDQGIIERIGNGGPASYYALKEKAELKSAPRSNVSSVIN